MIQDILLDDFGDLTFADGDLAFGDSDIQHVILIVNTMAGSWKQFPTCGVGIIQYSASSGKSFLLKSSIATQLEADGFANIEVTLKATDNDTYDYYINANRPT